MKIYLLLSILVLSSCSSYFKRKECESTNWYEYGQKVALEGRRLSGDQFLLECNKAEAEVDDSAVDRGFKAGMEKYCQPETIYQVGKAGNFFNTEMCMGGNLNTLRARHKQGVTEYCQKSNGYGAGAKGVPYNKICPADLEAAFLPEFKRGRKRYLQTELTQNESDINRLTPEISRLQTDVNYKSAQLANLRAMGGKDENSAQMVNNAYAQLHSLQSSLNEKQNQQNKLREENRKIQLELVQLD